MRAGRMKKEEKTHMKKLFALVLSLIMAFTCVSALAQTAESSLMTYDFGDFTMDFDENMPGNIVDKADNQVFFTLYPNYSTENLFNSNIIIVWGKASEDLSACDPTATCNVIVEKAASGMNAQNVATANAQILSAEMDELGGKAALSLLYTMDVDYTALGVDLKTMLYFAQAIVSDAAFGTYTFTITTDNYDDLVSSIGIMNTIVWAK